MKMSFMAEAGLVSLEESSRFFNFFLFFFFSPWSPDLFRESNMAQTEKKGGLLRKSSASKKPLKEKVVLMYDEIFTVRTRALLVSFM